MTSQGAILVEERLIKSNFGVWFQCRRNTQIGYQTDVNNRHTDPDSKTWNPSCPWQIKSNLICLMELSDQESKKPNLNIV